MSSPLEVSDNIAPAAAPEQSALQASTYFQGGNRDYFSAVEAAESSTTSSSADSMLNGFELDFGAEGSNSDNPASNNANDSSLAASQTSSQLDGSANSNSGDVNPEANPRDSEAHSRDSRNSSSDDEKPAPETDESKRERLPQEQPNEDKQESETCSISRFDRGQGGGLAGIFMAVMELQQRQACNEEIAEIRARNERRRQSLP